MAFHGLFTTEWFLKPVCVLLANCMVDDYKHKGARKKLVDLMISKGITDTRVLSAMLAVPVIFSSPKPFIRMPTKTRPSQLERDKPFRNPIRLPTKPRFYMSTKVIKYLK